MKAIIIIQEVKSAYKETFRVKDGWVTIFPASAQSQVTWCPES